MTKKQLADKVMKMVIRADEKEIAVLTVDEIARRFAVHRSTLSRAFRADFSIMTVKKLLELKKMISFEGLLESGKAKTVKGALDILDIRDPSHFIKRYKAFRGKTPGQFRRQCRENMKKNQQEQL